MEVEVVRSTRRRKTVQARTVGGVLRVSIPAAMSTAEEQRHVAEMVRRMQRRTESARVDLGARAAVLSSAHGLPKPASIRWVDNRSGGGDRALRPTAPSASPTAWPPSPPGCWTT